MRIDARHPFVDCGCAFVTAKFIVANAISFRIVGMCVVLAAKRWVDNKMLAHRRNKCVCVRVRVRVRV